MNKAFYIFLFFLGSFFIEQVLGDVQFKMEMRNHTDAEIHVVCKTITGYQKWIFAKGRVKVPPHSALTEHIKISRVSQSPHEEVQCTYSGKGFLTGEGSLIKVAEKTTDSIAVHASFGGVLRLVINPGVSKRSETEAEFDSYSEFVMASE